MATLTLPESANMPDTDIQIELARLDERVKTLEAETLSELLGDLRVKVGELSTQIRITWILLALILSGLASIAFSVWRSP